MTGDCSVTGLSYFLYFLEVHAIILMLDVFFSFGVYTIAPANFELLEIMLRSTIPAGAVSLVQSQLF